MEWLQLILPLACAFAVGVLANRWWAVALVLALGLAGIVYVGLSAERISVLFATRVVAGWALAAAAGVLVRRGVERALAARRSRAGA